MTADTLRQQAETLRTVASEEAWIAGLEDPTDSARTVADNETLIRIAGLLDKVADQTAE